MPISPPPFRTSLGATGNERTDWVDVAGELGRRLGLLTLFTTEFVEEHSPLRSARRQGGGAHGNAILSRFDVADGSAEAIPHTGRGAFSWDEDEWDDKPAVQRLTRRFLTDNRQQPRRGCRTTLAATLELPLETVVADADADAGNPVPGVAPVRVYSAHFEVFGGATGRVRSFGEVCANLRAPPEAPAAALLCGDLNTVGHGIMRLHPLFCTDSLRWASLGQSEPEWWATHVLSFTDDDGPTNPALTARLGMDEIGAADARNPGFHDPFDVRLDTTVGAFPLVFTSKLDWVLATPGLRPISAGLFNHAFSLADHKGAVVDYRLAAAADHTPPAAPGRGIGGRSDLTLDPVQVRTSGDGRPLTRATPKSLTEWLCWPLPSLLVTFAVVTVGRVLMGWVRSLFGGS